MVLYGSRTLGRHCSGSDVDLCLDAPDMTLEQLLNLETRLDDLLLPWWFDLQLDHLIPMQLFGSTSNEKVGVSGSKDRQSSLHQTQIALEFRWLASQWSQKARGISEATQGETPGCSTERSTP